MVSIFDNLGEEDRKRVNQNARDLTLTLRHIVNNFHRSRSKSEVDFWTSIFSLTILMGSEIHGYTAVRGGGYYEAVALANVHHSMLVDQIREFYKPKGGQHG